MRRYKIRCRFCIFYKVVNGRGYCDLFKITTFEGSSCEEGMKAKNED